MKYFLLILFTLSIVSCRTSSEEAAYTNEIYFEYENLITGELGTVTGFGETSTRMFSNAGISGSELPETFRQSIQVIYQSDNPDEQYPSFTFNLRPIMDSALVKPIDGQDFGQLYTYIDPEDYLREAFPLGSLLDGDTGVDFTYAPSYQETAITNSVELAGSAVGSFEITDHATFVDDQQRPSIFIKANFSGILRNNAFGPFSFQEHFHITNGRFSFTHPVDNE